MEDEHVVYDNGEVRIFAVFDGHGGDKVAKRCAEGLIPAIMIDFPNNKSSVPKYLINRFIEFDANMFLNSIPSGSTAVLVVEFQGTLFFANLGDSRAVLVKDGKVLHSTKDHKPTDPDERARITKAGGFVAWGRTNGTLALSRAFGDFDFKSGITPYMGRNAAVSPEPTITQHDLVKGSTLVVACDGLWDVLSNQYIATTGSQLSAEELTTLALRDGSRDNVTVVRVQY